MHANAMELATWFLNKILPGHIEGPVSSRASLELLVMLAEH